MSGFFRSKALLLAFLPFVWVESANATVVILDFEDPVFKVTNPPDGDPYPHQSNANNPPHSSHGRVVSVNGAPNAQFNPHQGVHISANNMGGGPNIAVIFDTRRTNTADPDLEDPFGNALRAGSNPAVSAPAGINRPNHVLIVQENQHPTPNCDGGVCSSPDDEADGPNKLTFDFEQTYADGVKLTSIDIFDVDDNMGDPYWEPENVMFTVEFTDGSADLMETVSGNDIGDNRGARIDLTTLFGQTLNNVGTLEVKFSGSGALDRLVFHTQNTGGGIPEPTSLAILLTGVAGLGFLHRGRRRRSCSVAA